MSSRGQYVIDYAKKITRSPASSISRLQIDKVVEVPSLLSKAGVTTGRARLIEDANFFCVVGLGEKSFIRFSMYFPLFTIGESSRLAPDVLAAVIEALRGSGFLYLDEKDLGGADAWQGDLTKDTLFNRLFGYYSE